MKSRVIFKGLNYKKIEVMLQPHRILRQPHLVYYEQLSVPHLRRDILVLKFVQDVFTSVKPGFQGLNYKMR